MYPDVSKEWHPTKNGLLKPSNVIPGSIIKVWWRCEKGHEWQSSVRNRSLGHSCDICATERRKITYHETRLKTRELLINCKCIEDWDYDKNEHGPNYHTKSSNVK